MRLPLFSDEARAIVRPWATYRALAAEAPTDGPNGGATPDRALLTGKVVSFLLVLGGFVSLTASGRLVTSHVAGTMVFWSFGPAIQAAAILLVLRLLAPRAPRTRALWMYFVGHGPWLLLLVAIAGVCLFAPHVYDAFMWLMSTFLLPGALLLTVVWGGVLTFAFFRAGLGLSRARASAATALYYALYTGAVLSWYFATNQIQPQLFGVPA